MEKILIVGANGYFGSTLLNYKSLLQGVDINYFKNVIFFKKMKKY